MAQQQRVSGRATSIYQDNRDTVVRYHETIIVRFNPKKITLDHGGWQTQTTRNRMVQASNQFGLGYRVFQKDFEWFVTYKGKTVPFISPLELER